MPKGTNEEIAERKQQIYIFELLSVPRQIQLSYAKEKWGIGKSSLDDYRREMQAQIQKDAEKFKKHALAKSLNLRNYLMFEALQKGDLRLVFDIQKDTDKLLGQYGAVRIQSESINYNFDINKLTDDKILRLAHGESLESVLDGKSANRDEITGYLPSAHDGVD